MDYAILVYLPPSQVLYLLQTWLRPLGQVETSTLRPSLGSAYPMSQTEKKFFSNWIPCIITTLLICSKSLKKCNLTVTILYFGEFLNAMPHVCNISNIFFLVFSSVVCLTSSRSSSINAFVATSSWMRWPQFLQQDSMT